MLAFLAYLSADMHLNGVCISLRMHLTRRVSPIGHLIAVAPIGVSLLAVALIAVLLIAVPLIGVSLIAVPLIAVSLIAVPPIAVALIGVHLS